MELLLAGLMVVAALFAMVGGVLFLVQAFRVSVPWGLGCVLLSFPVALIFLVKHWQRAKRPFLIQLVGLGIALVVMLVAMAAGQLRWG